MGAELLQDFSVVLVPGIKISLPSWQLLIHHNYTAEHFEWIKSEPQTSVMDYTAATRPGLYIPQCCTSGPPSHQLFLPETDPATLLNAASGYWCQSAEASHSLAQPHVPLCPCMSLAVKLAQASPLMVTSQPAFPHRLFETALWSSGQFESAAALEQFYPNQDLLRQGSWSLCSRGQLSPHDASPFHPFSNLFLTNMRQSDVRELLREEMVNGSYLHMMCPDIGNANQILLDGSTKGDSSWPWLLPSSPSHYQAPLLDGRFLAPGGFGGPEESEAGTEGMPLCVDGDGAGSYRGGLNQPSQATFGECSPQSNVDGVKKDCRRLTYVKVETEVWCHPQHSQVQHDTKLDIAAQALIQLSQIPIGSLSTPDGTASTDCQRTWES
ncbi:uncharacterized protein LOC116987153 [Amblyraja radiata]|uniref:uncharacterized protein LOC116987153 n=1 Tax=Amblyraja radiata TaxID=386614 RepID=UPI001403EC37|nr:uncharacterized protein LOC116987153 [Amblyraja radiata]